MKHKTRLYNVFFPLWMLLFFSVTWLLVVPVNWVFDSLVLLVAVAAMRLRKKKELYVKSIFRVWVFGFLADLAGAGVMALVYGAASLFLKGETQAAFLEAFMVDPWQHPAALLATALAVLVSACVIYVLNRRFTFQKQALPDATKGRLSLVLAAATAPYFFFVPLNWLI